MELRMTLNSSPSYPILQVWHRRQNHHHTVLRHSVRDTDPVLKDSTLVDQAPPLGNKDFNRRRMAARHIDI